MPTIKKWSTGPLGNVYPDHSERNNPNSRGLSIDGVPGIEGYIEEDRVLASEDNRPIQNLAQNDQVLEKNLASVASEVDYGVLRNKDNELKIEILQKGIHTDPESENDVEITPIRINSGQAIVNGQVVAIGSQKIIYFLKDDGSYIFPDYAEHEGKTVIPVTDDLYIGKYRPIYDTEASGLPENFTNYEIKITNKYDNADDRITYFKAYRDWEDIIPFTPHSESNETPLNFIYDENYGRESNGVWLSGGEVDNVKVSDVVVKKDIIVRDKLLRNEKFVRNGNTYEQNIVTDGIFFDNIPWKSETQDKRDVQDMYVDDEGNIYFAYKHKEANESIYYLPVGSTQVTNIPLLNSISQAIIKIVKVENNLYILGTNGYFGSYNIVNKSNVVDRYTFFNSSVENFRDVQLFQNKLWIATDKKIYNKTITSVTKTASFDVVNFAAEVDTITGNTGTVENINVLKVLYGNFYVDSSLKVDKVNYITNPSFERGGVGALPVGWSGTGFAISSGSGKFGSYKAVLSATRTATQTISKKFDAGTKLAFSTYLDSSNNISITLTISERNLANVVTTSTQNFSITGSASWVRFNCPVYTVLDSNSTISVSIKNNSTSYSAFVDGAQLELNSVEQFLDSFEYLFVGFKKVDTDAHNPPFGFIDAKRLQQVNYTLGMYGEIKTVNSIINKSSNNSLFVDDTNIYSLIILNDEDEYNRYSITNITKESTELNLNGKIESLKSIEVFNDRIFFGGRILNKAISFNVVDTSEEHIIEFISPDDDSIKSYLDANAYYYNILDVLGSHRTIPSYGTTGVGVEFSRVDELYETRSSFGTPGTYYPGGYYLFAIKIDGGEPIIFDIRMPTIYNGPVSIEDVYNLIVAKYPNQDIIKFNLGYSKSRVDGLYSIGKSKLTRHVRGNVGKIFKQKNAESQDHYDKGIYIMLDNAILRSKHDTNIKKSSTGFYVNKPDIAGYVDNMTLLPLSANIDDVYRVGDFGYYKLTTQGWVDTGYIYKWDLNQTEHSLREFKNKYNLPLKFNDESQSKSWINLPLTPGYKLVPGTLRIKTTNTMDIGFSEKEDYFVDYNSGRVIRSTLVNQLKDSNFEYVGTPSTSWQTFLRTTSGSTFHLGKKVDSYFTFNGDEKITDSYGSAYIESSGINSGAVYQFITPKSLNIGDTYTFSVKMKTNKYKTGSIQISECTTKTAAFDTMNGSTSLAYTIGEEPGQDPYNEWKTYIVTHTVRSSSSKYIRAEIRLEVESIHEQLFIKHAQLERNQIVTPYVQEVIDSRIDAGLSVYVDFTEQRNLVHGTDYTFDTAGRKIIYFNEIDNDTQLYFDYKYEKIFNPYTFGTSIPRFDIKYDIRDDYFLFLYSGKIWAINFVLALLSQDEDNPLVATYNYHYPRIDKIKIRNNPDQYGNYIYIVKGSPDELNPYGPYDKGTDRVSHVLEVSRDKIEDTISSDMIYEINVFDFDFSNNDIYDRRVYVDSRDNRFYNISLYDQTLGYFPYTKDFMSTSGINPINRLYNSKIVDIIKNFDIKQLEEVGAWGPNYQLALRNKVEYPGTGVTTFVDVDSGRDTNTGELFTPLKTIGEAIKRIRDGAQPNIIVKSQSLITEDIEIDLPVSEVKIFASSYTRWRGNIQNKTAVVFQGFQFENHNIYVVNDIEFYYCTFINSTINNYIPTKVYFSNCKVAGGKNTLLYIKNTVFPSPFLHPYQRNVSADDGVTGVPSSVATSDGESIYPNVNFYQQDVNGNPSGSYKFFRCLIDGLSDDIIKYELQEDEPWLSEFVFDRSTIVNNKNLFYTNKSSQTISYNECIIWNNSDDRGGVVKYFDSQSNINLQNCYIDISITEDSSLLNFNQNGLIFGRDTCINGQESEPGFISTQNGFENYRLRSEAMGFLTNAVCIGRATDGRDIGCYDELRERLDVEVPKKLKSYFALLGEGIHYPIVINSEKITFTLEFKPSAPFSTPAVLFDTRSSASDKDYIIVTYNNNTGSKVVDFEPDTTAAIDDPYTFKIIVANEKTKYAIVSPINMYSDADYQVWNKLSFTVNYEKTFNEKAAFDEKDKYQNVITMYHNSQLAVESFLKNDLNYDDHNILLSGSHNDNSNDWNYNTISSLVTIGSTYDQQYILNGYYSELRIDNKFINRKELEAWNNKVVPFNDPITYIDQNNLARTFDSSIVNDMWTLKTKYDLGAKGHRFNEFTEKRFTYEGGEFTWALVQPTTNILANSDLSTPIFASVTTDIPPNNDTQNLFPVTFDHTMTIKTIGGNSFDTTTGITIDFTASGKQFYSHDELYEFLVDAIHQPQFSPTKIEIVRLRDNRFRVITKDYLATQIEVKFSNGGDAEEFGFTTALGQGSGYYATNTANGSKTITGTKNISSVVITSGIDLSMSAEHNTWLEFGDEYTRLSPTSLGISRKITDNNNDNRDNDTNINKYIRVITNRKTSSSALGIYDPNSESPNEYTYSAYIYRKNNIFPKSDLRVIVQEGSVEYESDFDKIENIYGYWWLASKTIRIVSDPLAKIGMIVKGQMDIYIDAVQLERATFASPYVTDSDSNQGVIEVDKALLAENRGVILFRFKPLFRYNTLDKKILLEALAEKFDQTGNVVLDETRGFKVWYEYDVESEKGSIQFRTSTIEAVDGRQDESAWEITALEQFWDTWHTVVISYDFETKRFIYFFDYFKNTVDSSVQKYDFATNLFLGRNAVRSIENGEAVYPFGSKSADILIKDLLITNYTTSDNELKNWINANEFYKETLFNNLLNNYQDEMFDAIAQIKGLSNDTHNIEYSINILQSKVGNIESIVNANSDIDFTLLKVRQDELRNEVYHGTNGILTKLNILDTARATNSLDIVTNRNEIIIHAGLIQENTDNIAAEVSSRIDAVNNVIVRLSNHTLGDGASMIGINDVANKFSATDVEGVLFEIEGRVKSVETNISIIQSGIATVDTTIELMQHGIGASGVWTPSKAINNGWNIATLRTELDAVLIQTNTIQTNLASEVVNRADADIAVRADLTTYIDTSILGISGNGRTNQTIKGNWDLIQSQATSIATAQTTLSIVNTELNKVKDGSSGSAWTETMNLKSHDDSIVGLDTLTTSHTTQISVNTTDLTSLTTRVTTTENGLTAEISTRTQAINKINNDLSSTSAGLGASLIGVRDFNGVFVASNVEDVLQEIDSKIQALVGSITWKASVLDVTSLPTNGNGLNDARIVENDGDGKRAQYIWNGTLWIKVSDVDWGDASGIVYDNLNSGLLSNNVKSAIDELYERSVSPNSNGKVVTSAQWTSAANINYIDFVHGLETKNIAVRAVDAAGQEFGVEDIQRIDNNTIRIFSATAIDAEFTVFGAKNSYSKVVGSWTPAGGMYLKDIIHSFDTNNIMLSIFNIITGERIGVDSIETLDRNAIRIMTDNNTDVLNVFILNKTSNATTKDIEYWYPSLGMYESALPLALDYDAVYSFFDVTTGKSVEVDTVKFEGGLMKIRRTENTPLRMVVLK